MSMQALMAQGAPPPGQGAPPPDPNAMAALMGGAPGGDPNADPNAAPGVDPNQPGGSPGGGVGDASQGPGEEGGEPPGDETSIYQQMIDLGQQALSLPTVDAIEAADVQKCISALQSLLAKNQKSVDSALGTNPQLRKALAGGGGA